MTASIPRSISLTLLAVLVVGSAPLLGEQRGDRQGPATVTVSFLAVSSDGQPVTDLTAGDVTLTVGGRVRTLESLRLVEFGVETEAPAGAAPAGDLGGGTIPPPSPYATNPVVAAPSGDVRSVMIVVNDMTIRPGTEPGIRNAISGFLDALGPATRVAFVTLPQGTNNIDFTTDRALLDGAVEQMAGRAPPNMSSADFRCQTLELLGGLTGMWQSMAGAASPTTLVFISAGLAEAPIDASSVSECQLRPDDYTVLTRVASAAQVHMYVLQADGLRDSLEGDRGLETLAGVTNGERSLIGNAGDVVLARVARETTAYYAASFVPEPDERDSEAPLGIDVARDGVTVRAPTSVVFAGSGGGGGGSGGEGAADVSPQDMLRVTDPFTDLQLKATAASSRIGPNAENVRVLALFEPADRSAVLEEASAGLVSADGTLVAQWTAQPQELAAYPVLVALEAVPGPYRLRVAAKDAEGQGGAVDQDIELHLHPADTVFISDLALLGPRGESMAPTLEFRDEANAVVYFELYGQPPPDLFATIDLARSIDGDVLAGVQLQAAPSAEADKFLITGTLPIRALEPGDYVVRVTVGREPEAKMYQTVRKLPPAGG
jgi:hypothetical protein